PGDDRRLVELVDPVLVLYRVEERQSLLLGFPVTSSLGAVASAGGAVGDDGQSHRKNHESVFEAQALLDETHFGVRKDGLEQALEERLAVLADEVLREPEEHPRH